MVWNFNCCLRNISEITLLLFGLSKVAVPVVSHRPPFILSLHFCNVRRAWRVVLRMVGQCCLHNYSICLMRKHLEVMSLRGVFLLWENVGLPTVPRSLPSPTHPRTVRITLHKLWLVKESVCLRPAVCTVWRLSAGQHEALCSMQSAGWAYRLGAKHPPDSGFTL